jgi:hypothetical protein
MLEQAQVEGEYGELDEGEGDDVKVLDDVYWWNRRWCQLVVPKEEYNIRTTKGACQGTYGIVSFS